jgi:hypothetical protein
MRPIKDGDIEDKDDDDDDDDNDNKVLLLLLLFERDGGRVSDTEGNGCGGPNGDPVDIEGFIIGGGTDDDNDDGSLLPEGMITVVERRSC